MASTTRLLARCSSRASPFTASGIKSSIPHATRTTIPRSAVQTTSRRAYASGSGLPPLNSNVYILGGLTAGAVGVYWYFTGDVNSGLFPPVPNSKEAPSPSTPTGSSSTPSASSPPAQKDYQAVYNDIARLLEDNTDYDDGSYGPVIVRLAWHCSGTYDAATNTGGSNGATMRFAPERDHGANSGLKAAREFLEPVKAKFPWITYSDLWTLAGVAAIQEMQGPRIPWRPGRSDRDVSFCTPDGRLPDGAKGGDHLRAIFGRMGFSDQEIVALSGAHALGRCHTDRSGFEGPWSFSPTVVSNDYFRLLLDEKWGWKKWNGPKQYEDLKTKTLMMLPTDMALVQDKVFRPHVQRYAQDHEVFFKEFSDVVCKLFELGVPFKEGQQRMEFATSVE